MARSKRRRSGRRGDPTRRERLRRELLDLIRSGALSASVSRTAGELLDRSDKYGSAPWWSRVKLAENAGVAPCTITRHTAALEAAGFLVVDRAKAFDHPTHGWTRWRTNRYRFCRPAAGGSVSSRDPSATSGPLRPPAAGTADLAPSERPLELFQDTHPPPPVDPDAAARLAELRRHPTLSAARALRRPSLR